MKVLEVRNVQEALPKALDLLFKEGVRRESRNGPVLYGGPVTTVYSHPLERVLFWYERDANPFFHLYESIWMLAGRNDVKGPERYAKNMSNYTDDGDVFHGAYGHRWRNHFGETKVYGNGIGEYREWQGLNQLPIIAERLKKDPDDRRCILQMWDAVVDLGKDGKDFPCNTIASFQRGINGELNLSVFCRSNDIVWGAYGANAVQFSTLLEYMAVWIGCPVGTYEQISVNWHGYLNTIKPVENLRPDRAGYVYNPYIEEDIYSVAMPDKIEELDESIKCILNCADSGFRDHLHTPSNEWQDMVIHVLYAHEVYRTGFGLERYLKPMNLLKARYSRCDWVVAAIQWLERRLVKQTKVAG